MITLKKPYTPSIFVGASKAFSVYGRSFYNIQAIYLSGAPYQNTTFFNPFSAVPRLSALYPGFNAIRLQSSEYSSNNENIITLTMPSASRAGFVDIIVQNEAGYGILSRCVIKELYNTSFTQLELRPWSSGINVIKEAKILPPPPKQLFTFKNEMVVTINGRNIIQI
jgi:hypothetical protein